MLTSLRAQLDDEGHAGRVTLIEDSAKSCSAFPEDSFDSVVVNSVVQYFPSISYLDDVLANCARIVRPGGHLFIGDVRSLPLLPIQASSIEAFKAEPTTLVEELRRRVQACIRQEPELVLSPSYFSSLPQRVAKVSHVEIYPKRGYSDNEMTRFRYDVVISIGSRPVQLTEVPFFDQKQSGYTLNAILQELSNRRGRALGLSNICNARLEKEADLFEKLSSADAWQTFDALCEPRTRSDSFAIHPEELVRVAAEIGYQAAISWSTCATDGSYDAAFVGQQSSNVPVPKITWRLPSSRNHIKWGNTPGQASVRQKLTEQLLSYCQDNIPNHPVSFAIGLVDAFPRGPDGSVDREALLTKMRTPWYEDL